MIDKPEHNKLVAIDVAARLRFPRFPSELGRRGNARLRPHTHRRHSPRRMNIDESNRGALNQPLR